MKLKILSFSGESFSSDNVVSATMMTAIGEITILDNHSPLLTSIKPSTMYVIYKDESGNEKRDDFAIGKGVVEVSNSEVKVMADMLIDIEDLDVEAAERARTKAIELMEKYRDAKDKLDMEKFIEAEDMLLKSIAQLKLSDSLK
ncbi:MAG: ATP synthase F1 subunit epsilon [Candidatus Gracilibacteria bacterium]|nr:ATP synthase F1 subunit epsilon [Candidatus Gracilibacteria bacterium]